MQAKRGQQFTVDASVLIDYCNSDLSVLETLSRRIGPVHIARPAVDEVHQLTLAEARHRGFTIVLPELEIALEAASRRGGLSFSDHVTLLLARQNSWCCITSEKELRRECKKEGVSVLWGLEPMKILVANGAITPAKALKTAKLIQVSNPAFITPEIITKFEKQIGQILRQLPSKR